MNQRERDDKSRTLKSNRYTKGSNKEYKATQKNQRDQKAEKGQK